MEERNEVEAMNTKYQEVLDWEAQFAEEIEVSKQTHGSNFTVVIRNGNTTAYKGYQRVNAMWKFVQAQRKAGNTCTVYRHWQGGSVTKDNQF